MLLPIKGSLKLHDYHCTNSEHWLNDYVYIHTVCNNILEFLLRITAAVEAKLNAMRIADAVVV